MPKLAVNTEDTGDQPYRYRRNQVTGIDRQQFVGTGLIERLSVTSTAGISLRNSHTAQSAAADMNQKIRFSVD
jgi:hypothetical protein